MEAKTRSELEDLTKDELIEYADDLDIEVHHHWVKDDIVKEILKGQKAAAKQEAAAESEPAEPESAEEAAAGSLAEQTLAEQEAGAAAVAAEEKRLADLKKAGE